MKRFKWCKNGYFFLRKVNEKTVDIGFKPKIKIALFY